MTATPTGTVQGPDLAKDYEVLVALANGTAAFEQHVLLTEDEADALKDELERLETAGQIGAGWVVAEAYTAFGAAGTANTLAAIRAHLFLDQDADELVCRTCGQAIEGDDIFEGECGDCLDVAQHQDPIAS